MESWGGGFFEFITETTTTTTTSFVERGGDGSFISRPVWNFYF